ncbi:Erythromycin C-12 hydroxylase [Mycolicibacterium hassiacum DSM 44199]|uniref:hypothetical protein n=1 Tax=Mycolicibacterium hassiacum TaxID=46351 RepID=UPI000475476C|nr:hypothetical protein [Mycolicibacterium hassiacum]MBX5488103.1 hypothetical protein [Mycolicibacterium hassiacum]PZN15896.1 MAG: hypothetical protein DIU75_20260 [Mycolicibacterium hassiacum]VCT90556.1 Erythromycin C-12 hydroxylase [Mycolicibacterium hassiacum DSM 44199]
MPDRHGTSDSAVARQCSAVTVCEALGFPAEDWPMFARWATTPMTPAEQETLFQYVDVKIAERCWKQGDDLLSRLITLEENGRALTTDEIHRFVAGLVGANVF